MNVWIWGPCLWDTLQSSAFLCDSYTINPVPLLKPLKVLLPCIFCRNSYKTFYDELGDPAMGKSAFYVYKIHETVNKKLSTQRIEAFIEKQTNWTLDQKSFFRNSSLEMFQDATIKPFHSPTMEVLKKRFLVNREESLSWRNLSTSLLAIVMALQEHPEPLKYKSELETFLKALRSVVLSAKQYNSTSIVQVLDAIIEQKSYEEMRSLLENAKYSPIIPAVYSDVKVITNLVKAGACIENTCT